MTRVACAIVILSIAVPSAISQTAAKGGIQGVVKDDSGKPVAGAIAVATGVGTSTHQSHTVTTTVTGAYSFIGLEPGQYQVCVQVPGGPNLDAGEWCVAAVSAVYVHSESQSGAASANDCWGTCVRWCR
jgi:hypothetical protein